MAIKTDNLHVESGNFQNNKIIEYVTLSTVIFELLETLDDVNINTALQDHMRCVLIQI